MKTIGTNAIRVYHVDPTADHSSCMNTFANAGIYLFVDLDTFSTQISQVSYRNRRVGISLDTWVNTKTG